LSDFFDFLSFFGKTHGNTHKNTAAQTAIFVQRYHFTLANQFFEISGKCTRRLKTGPHRDILHIMFADVINRRGQK